MVIRAVRAPLRSIRALVASVVPWIDEVEFGAADAGLGEDGAGARDDRVVGGFVGGQELGGEGPVGQGEHEVGEGAADVDGEAGPGGHSVLWLVRGQRVRDFRQGKGWGGRWWGGGVCGYGVVVRAGVVWAALYAQRARRLGERREELASSAGSWRSRFALGSEFGVAVERTGP